MRMAPTAHYARWITSLAFTVIAGVEPGRHLSTVAPPTDPGRLGFVLGVALGDTAWPACPSRPD
jgi:hypothetical protein